MVQTAGIRLDLDARGLGEGPALLAVRPRAIQLTREHLPNSAEVTIAKAAYLGSHMEYEIEGPLGELFVIDPHVDKPFTAGGKAWLELAPRGVTLVADPT